MDGSGSPRDARSGVGTAAGEGSGPAVAPARPPGPRHFVGGFEHSVDDKNRLVLPAVFRPRLAAGAYLGPLHGPLALWPEDQFDSVLAKWTDGIGLGMVAEELFEDFMALTYFVQPDSQGRIAVHRDLQAFAEISGPVMVVGATHRVTVWARDRWEQRRRAIPGGPDDAIRQAARDLKL